MQIDVIDSHTGGEPTRVVVSGWDVPQGSSLPEIRDYLRTHQKHLLSGVTIEPRGSDVYVCALLVPAFDPECCTGVVFFNNVDTLGMCGHGTIGVVETLRFMGQMEPGIHKIETPVGIVEVHLEDDGTVWVTNVPSYAHAQGVCVETEHYGTICGDVVWGGNWFFLMEPNAFIPDVLFENRNALTEIASNVKEALWESGITGKDGAMIDHVEIFGPPTVPGAHSKNFVLCPGLAYDRSACGTGTSAKMASLYQKGKLSPETHWVQESITGTTFTGFVSLDGDKIIPHISGKAHITAKSTLIFDETDPFRWGIS